MRILCYGDSNTWGTLPDGSCRHGDVKKAYPYLLEQKLKKYFDDVAVISEGLPARTTNLDDIKSPNGNRNGALFFPQCVSSHDPLDYVILFLGTNDLKTKFNREVKDSVKALEEQYIFVLRNVLDSFLTQEPKIIIVAPPLMDDTVLEEYKGSAKKSLKFESSYKKLAKTNNCLFVSSKNLTCGYDGVHLNEQGHITLADEIAKIIVS